MYCQKCGARILRDAKFCTGCGRTLKASLAKNKSPSSIIPLIFRFKKLLLLFACLIFAAIGLYFLIPKVISLLPKNKLTQEIEKQLAKKSPLEMVKYSQAEKLALEWDAKAKLCDFHAIIEKIDDPNPWFSFTFVNPTNTKLYSITFNVSGKVDKEEKPNQFKTLNAPLSSFPLPLEAWQALEIAQKEADKLNSTKEPLADMHFLVNGDNPSWYISLDFGQKENYQHQKSIGCNVNFQKVVDCKLNKN